MKPYLFIILYIFLSYEGNSQVDKFTIGDIHLIHSEILNEERKIAVFTPEGYQGSEEKYQVLFLCS